MVQNTLLLLPAAPAKKHVRMETPIRRSIQIPDVFVNVISWIQAKNIPHQDGEMWVNATGNGERGFNAHMKNPVGRKVDWTGLKLWLMSKRAKNVFIVVATVPVANAFRKEMAEARAFRGDVVRTAKQYRAYVSSKGGEE